jgi:hypothetical protein
MTDDPEGAAVDLTSMTDDELRELERAARAELDRRRTIEQAPQMLARLAEAFLRARGAKPGDPWRPPVTGSPVEAYYPAGWRVMHKDAVWEAEEAGTITEPGSGAGWRLVSGEAPEPADFDPEVTYRRGDRVRFASQVWESQVNGNTASPAEDPPAWDVVTS